MPGVYVFRYDLPHTIDVRLTLVKWIRDNTVEGGKAMLAEEHGEATGKEHYQGFMTFAKSLDTFKRSSPFPQLKGTAASHVKCHDLPHLESYLTKEKLVYHRGYTQEDIDSIPQWQPKAHKERKKNEFMSSLIDNYRKQFGTKELELEELAKFVYEHLTKHRKTVDKYIFDRLVNGLVMQVCPIKRKYLFKELFSDLYLCRPNEDIERSSVHSESDLLYIKSE